MRRGERVNESMTPIEHEQAPHSRVVALIDVDRTLIKSDYVFGVAMHAARQLGLDEATEAELMRREQENQGNAFDYLAELSRLAPSIDHSKIVERILADYEGVNASELMSNVFAPGAFDLLDVVHETSTRGMLLTAGGVETQTMKLQLVEKLLEHMGMKMFPWVIVDDSQQEKTALAASVYDADRQEFDFVAMARLGKASSGVEMPAATDVEWVYVFDDKTSNTAPTHCDAVVGVLVDRAERQPDGEERIPLDDAALLLRDLVLRSDA